MDYQKKLLQPDAKVHLGGYTCLNPRLIVRLGADRNYTYIYHEDGQKILISVTLKRVEKILKPFGHFIRVNRKDLINVNFIRKFNPDGTFLLINGETIIPSRRRINTLKISSLN